MSELSLFQNIVFVGKCSGLSVCGVAVCGESAKRCMQMSDFSFLVKLKHGFNTTLHSSLRLFLDLSCAL
jgi:hypothetical protein